MILLALMCYIAVICTKPAPEHEEDDPDHDHHDGHSSEESDETVLLTSEYHLTLLKFTLTQPWFAERCSKNFTDSLTGDDDNEPELGRLKLWDLRSLMFSDHKCWHCWLMESNLNAYNNWITLHFFTIDIMFFHCKIIALNSLSFQIKKAIKASNEYV